MDDFTRYVFFNFSNLWTQNEGLAYKSIVGEMKAQHSQSPEMQQMLRKEWVSQDPEVLHLLEGGEEQFYFEVVQRVMQECSNEVFLNRCPRCRGLARTPQAKQCRQCFFSWHEPQ